MHECDTPWQIVHRRRHALLDPQRKEVSQLVAALREAHEADGHVQHKPHHQLAPGRGVERAGDR